MKAEVEEAATEEAEAEVETEVETGAETGAEGEAGVIEWRVLPFGSCRRPYQLRPKKKKILLLF